MTSPFTLRPKVDTANSDNWAYTIKSHPTKDYWEHIFAADDGIYLYSDLNDHTIGTVAMISEDDIPSISSGSGTLTNVTCYARGKVVGSGTFILNAQIGAYGADTYITEGDGYVTATYVCTQYTDLGDDLWVLVMGGYIGFNSPVGVKTFDYVYAVVNYVPAPPTCFQQSIVLSEDGKTLIVSETRYRYYTWLKARGYQLKVKDSEDILYTDEVEGDRSFREMAWFEGARYTEREIDVSAYVRCGVVYEARSWGETDDGIGYGAWVELSFPCPTDFPLAPVVFPAQPNMDTDELRQKCRNFEESMSDICLVLNHNVDVTKRYLLEVYGDTIYPENSNLRYVLPSQQLVKLMNKGLEAKDFNAIINNFITNISSMFSLINENNRLVKAWLDDYEPDESGHDFIDVKMRLIIVGEDLSKAMDELFENIEDNVVILNSNLELLKERF